MIGLYHRHIYFYSLLRAVITAALAAVIAPAVTAQNNYFKIDDHLYSIYVKASHNKTHKLGLQLADSMMNEAIRIGDKKAQCLACVIYVQHYFDKKDERAMVEAVKRLQAISRKKGYEQYYYFGGANLVGYYLNNRKQKEALNFATSLRDEAVRTNNNYGIFSAMRSLGNIHLNRNDNTLAIKNYSAAAEYAKQHNLYSELSQIYTNIASAYFSQHNYEKTIKYALLAINTKHEATSFSDFNAKTLLCKVYYEVGDYENFLKYYNMVKKDRRFYAKPNPNPRRYIEVCHYLYQNDFERVDSIINSINDATDLTGQRYKLYFKSMRHRKANNYFLALEASENYRNFCDSIFMQLSHERLMNYDTQLVQHILLEQMRSSEIENTRLKIANSELELEHINHDLLNSKIQARNDSLAAYSANLQMKKSRTDYEKMKLAQQRSDEQDRLNHERLIIYVVAAAAALFIILLLIAACFRGAIKLKKKHRELSERNAALSIARKNAEDADKTKTAFLQNMSHEIRTPLNAIVGFSQILAESGDDLDEDDKTDFSQRIEINAELMENIINDILNITSLESGHYKMQMSVVPVNEMCRQAINENPHPLHNEVEMRFTTDLPDDFCVMTDRLRTVEVLANMLSNAVKNTDSGYVELHCTTSAKDGMLTFSVTDTGVGIKPEIAEHIFDRFYKVSEFVQGVGLGLTICRTITTLLGGSIYLDTAHSPGARFVFEIPSKRGQQTQ